MTILDKIIDLEFDDFLVGEYESNEAASGLTAIFPQKKNITGISQMGGSPGAMNTEVLHPLHRKNTSVDAIVVTGRSIFGFSAAMGVIHSLQKDGKGLRIRDMDVPIVPVSAIFDFLNNNVLPDESWGIKAYENRSQRIHIGRHGAGRGATVGKVAGIEYSMPSGQGFALINKGDLKVGVYVVVNSFGDVYDDSGKIIAGARKGKIYLNSFKYIQDKSTLGVSEGYNTTVAVVLTNAKMDREDACRVSSLVNLSIGTYIKPFNTEFDGDTVFTISTGEIKENMERVTAIAQNVTRESIQKIFLTD